MSVDRPRVLVRLAVAALAIVAVMQCAERQSVAAWPAVPRANVLVVTIDTLRADRLTERYMPALAAFVGAGRRFERAYAHAPLTLPSHASIFTGQLPPTHGVRGNGAFRLGDTHVTLAERLATAGYRTAAFVGAFVLDARFGLAQGFSVYRGVDDERSFASDFAFAERPAASVLADAEYWLHTESAGANPWFAWVHLFDPHAPHEASAGGAPGNYDDDVRRVDVALGAFFSRLRARGALERTVVVVTADHGEGLGDHGESTHGLFAYESTIRVPLAIVAPDVAPGVDAAPVAHVDLVPTLLDTLDLPADASLPGRSLRTGARAAADIYVEAMDGWLAAGAAPLRAVVRGARKLIDVPEVELYDLAEDPSESANLSATSAPEVRSLRTAVASVGAGRTDSSRSSGAETEVRLRALGYASGASWPPERAFSIEDDPKRLRPLYERFQAALSAGRPDPRALAELVRERPAFDAARLVAASLYIEAGRPRDAVAILEDAPRADGGGTTLAERLGAAWLAAGEPSRVVQVLTPVVGSGAATADAWNTLAVAHASLGASAEARRAIDQAVALAPDAARFQFNRVLMRLESGEGAAAALELDRLLESAPRLADGWRLRATLRHQSGDRHGAVGDWEHVVALEPSDRDTLYNLAVTLHEMGRADAARAAAARYLALPTAPGSGADAARVRAIAGRR